MDFGFFFFRAPFFFFRRPRLSSFFFFRTSIPRANYNEEMIHAGNADTSLTDRLARRANGPSPWMIDSEQ